jgi:porin
LTIRPYVSSLLVSIALLSWSFDGVPRASAAPSAASAKPAPAKPAAVEADDDKDEGGEAPDGEDRAPAGTGHGKGKATGTEGVLGDIHGVRPFFERYGVTFDASETSEVLGNPTGGRRQGAIYEGLFSVAVGVDLERLAGLKGASANVSVFQIHGGPGLSAQDIGNFDVVSDLENKRDSGLYEAWLQQSFGGSFDIRAGRMSVDEEFLIADSADVFMNGSFGWPTLPYKDLPNGGPIPSDAAVRAHARLAPGWDALAGLYRGSQADTRGAGGAASTSAVSQDDGLLAIAELQFQTGRGETELPGTYKVGGWYRDGGVTRGGTGRTGADLFESLPDIVRHDFSFYAVADHRLTRGAAGEDSGFSAFLRVMAAPSDRNVVSAFADGGLVYSGPFGRPDDGVGIGFAVAQTSATSLDGLGRTEVRLGKAEKSFEVTYQAQLAKGVQVQPDVQYVIDPAGGHVGPAGRVTGDALVLGLRTTITF